MSYRLLPLSGAGSMAANAHLLELAGARVLLDCGASPGGESAWLDALLGDELPDLVWLSHAHWDHLGALARLRERAPRLPVFATPATRVLGRGVLASGLSAGLSSGGLSSGGLSGGQRSGVSDRAASLMDTVEALEFHRPHRFADLTLTAVPAGHLAGAAALMVEACGRRVVYSGDVSRGARPGAPGFAPASLGALDLLVLEGALCGARRLDDLDRAAERERLVGWLVGRLGGADSGPTRPTGPTLCAVAPFGEAAEVVAALVESRGRMAGRDFVVHDALREPLSLFASAGAFDVADGPAPLRFATTSDCRDLLEAGAFVVAPGDQLQPGSPAGVLAGALLERSEARIALLNAQSSGSPGGRLARAPRRSRLTFDGRRVRVKARVERFYLPLHATRPELVELACMTDAARIALVHARVDPLHDLRRAFGAAGCTAEVVVALDGQAIEG